MFFTQKILKLQKQRTIVNPDLCEGYDFWDLYLNRLDELFLKHPDNKEYLYLEGLRSPKGAALHIVSRMSEVQFNTELFGRTLMKLVGQIYKTSDLTEFDRRMYSLWNNLPTSINYEQPFFTFCYVGDCLSYGDKEQCRRLYEQAIFYYN